MCIALLFTSCENFMQGAELREELESKIAYYNAQQVNVTISCPDDMGIVYPYGSYSTRVGFEFELQFKPKSENYYIKDLSKVFEAVKYNDNSLSLNDCVEFSAVTRTQEDVRDGLYRVKAKVVKDVSDMLIRPKCLLIPEITSVQTNMTNGILSPGNPVTVVFNMPMDEDQLNYTNISIKANGSDISEFFENPELYENKLLIKPKFEQLKNYIENILALKTLEVVFTFSNSITNTIENVAVHLKQNEYSTFKLIYSSVQETEPPACNTFFVTAESIGLENASAVNSQNYFSASCTSNDEKLKNRTKGFVYLYGVYNDTGSGIRVLKLQVQKTKDLRNKDIHKITKYNEYYPSASDSKFLITEDGNVSFCIDYEFTDGDGTYELEFTVEDGCGNQSKKQMTVFVENELYGETRVTNSQGTTLLTYNDELKKLLIATGRNWDPDGPYGNPNFEVYGAGGISYDFNHCDVVCKYIGSDETEKEAVVSKFTSVDTSVNYIRFTLDEVDSVAELQIKMIVTSDIGSQYIENIVFPSKPILESISIYESDYDSTRRFDVSFSNPAGVSWGRLLLLTDDNELSDISRRGWCVEGETIYYSFGSEGSLYGPLSDPVTIDSTPVTLNSIKIINHNIQKSLINPKGYDVTLNVNSEEWERYDSIYLVNPSEGTEKYYFNDETNSCTFTTINNFFYQGLKVKLFGVKNNQITEAYYVISNFNREEQDEFGKFPPYVKLYRNFDDVQFEILDNESGIASAAIEFCNKPDNKNFETIILDEDDIDTYYSTQGAFNVTIPIWKIGEAGGIIINAKDKKGNIMPEEYYYPDLSCYGGIFYAYDCTVTVGDWTSGQYVPVEETHWKASVSFWENLTSGKTIYMDKWDVNDKCFKNWKVAELAFNGPNEQDLDFGKLNPGFYKISSKDVFYIPYYFYIGDHSGNWDFLVSNAENSRSVLISSDAPVYVTTYAVNIPYEECVNYDINFWEEYKRVIDDTLMDFSSSNHDFQSYMIDLEKIPKNYSYVIVAHYADGKKIKSHVYFKNW